MRICGHVQVPHACARVELEEVGRLDALKMAKVMT
uniref:Uncharacterized protein n=1 Tax=Anguilla anguilla TaxID=7936 RepID=A0A0E9VV53_ANGAN